MSFNIYVFDQRDVNKILRSYQESLIHQLELTNFTRCFDQAGLHVLVPTQFYKKQFFS